MSKYLIEFKKVPAVAIMTYNSDGCLIYYEHTGEWQQAHFYFFYKRFPFILKNLEELKLQKTFALKITQIAEDISFERFWEEYAHKKGKKERVVKIWKRMSETECIQALEYIKRYDAYLAMNRGVSKKYPETFLNTKEWEN